MRIGLQIDALKFIVTSLEFDSNEGLYEAFAT